MEHVQTAAERDNSGMYASSIERHIHLAPLPQFSRNQKTRIADRDAKIFPSIFNRRDVFVIRVGKHKAARVRCVHPPSLAIRPWRISMPSLLFTLIQHDSQRRQHESDG